VPYRELRIQCHHLHRASAILRISSTICPTTELLVVVSGGAASAPAVPAAFMSLVAAMPAHAAGAGAELVRPSTSAVQSAVEKTPTLLESTSIDQAVNSVVDVVKVVASKVSALPQCTRMFRSASLYCVDLTTQQLPCTSAHTELKLLLAAGRRWCRQKPGSCCWQRASICPTGPPALCTSSCCSACFLAGLLYLYWSTCVC